MNGKSQPYGEELRASKPTSISWIRRKLSRLLLNLAERIGGLDADPTESFGDEYPDRGRYSEVQFTG